MKQKEVIDALPYLLAFLAILYLASPHIYECYQAYSRPWDTNENKVTEKTVKDEEIEHMTNADVAKKHEFHADKDNQVWSILPGVPTPSGSKSILPGVPTPGPSNKHEVEPAIEKPPETLMEAKEERANLRIMDKEVQKPVSSPKKSEPPRKVMKVSAPLPLTKPAPSHHPQQPLDGKEIWGPLAPKFDPNQPRPSDSGNGKHSSGVYPHIYGPDTLEPPGSKDKGDIDMPDYDYLPAAEFPAGPLQPSPYLNDFSKILKT